MNLILNFSEGRDHLGLLKRVDFRSLQGPLCVDIDRVPFFYPSTLAILYGAFKFHQAHNPTQERKCIPPSLKSCDTDVNRYIQRVNFFNCCPEFSSLREESFKRHGTADRFVPLTEIYSMDDTDRISEEMVRVIFSQSKAKGQAEAKYVFSELIDNALQHA